jgi:hypothetical protein
MTNAYQASARLKGQIIALREFAEKNGYAPVDEHQAKLMQEHINVICRELDTLRDYLPAA